MSQWRVLFVNQLSVGLGEFQQLEWYCQQIGLSHSTGTQKEKITKQALVFCGCSVQASLRRLMGAIATVHFLYY